MPLITWLAFISRQKQCVWGSCGLKSEFKQVKACKVSTFTTCMYLGRYVDFEEAKPKKDHGTKLKTGPKSASTDPKTQFVILKLMGVGKVHT